MAIGLNSFMGLEVQTDPFSAGVRLRDKDGFTICVPNSEWYEAQSHPDGRDRLMKYYLTAKREYELGRQKSMVRQFEVERGPSQYVPTTSGTVDKTPPPKPKFNKLLLLCEDV